MATNSVPVYSVDFGTWIVIDDLPAIDERQLWSLLDVENDSRIICKRYVASVTRRCSKTAILIYDNANDTNWALTSLQLQLREMPVVPLKASDILSYVEMEEQNLSEERRSTSLLERVVKISSGIGPQVEQLLRTFGQIVVCCEGNEDLPSIISFKKKSSAISAVWGLDNFLIGDRVLKVELKFPSRKSIPYKELTLVRMYKRLAHKEKESTFEDWIQKPGDMTMSSIIEDDLRFQEGRETGANYNQESSTLMEIQSLKGDDEYKAKHWKTKLLETTRAESAMEGPLGCANAPRRTHVPADAVAIPGVPVSDKNSDCTLAYNESRERYFQALAAYRSNFCGSQSEDFSVAGSSAATASSVEIIRPSAAGCSGGISSTQTQRIAEHVQGHSPMFLDYTYKAAGASAYEELLDFTKRWKTGSSSSSK